MVMSQTDWQAVRSQFPVCSRVTYLNAAGGSPMCASASMEGKRYFDEMLLYGDTYWDDWLERTELVRAGVARFIHAEKEEIAFTPNTSAAMGIIAQLLKNRGAVLTMEDEFPSSTFPWINLDYQVDFVHAVKGTYSMKSIENAIRPEHRILVTSYVQYKTGFRQNLVKLGQLCKSANLIMVINATQGMGVFPVDVRESRIDFMVFSGLKWACAGYGASGLFIRHKYLSDLRIPVAGWRSVKSPETMNNRLLDLKEEASALEAGSPSFPAVFALGGSLALLESIGAEERMERVIQLSRLLEEKLRENGFPVLYSFPDQHRSGIIMIKTTHAKTAVQELAAKNILVSARGDGLRVSVNIFNNESDIRVLISALNDIKALF